MAEFYFGGYQIKDYHLGHYPFNEIKELDPLKLSIDDDDDLEILRSLTEIEIKDQIDELKINLKNATKQEYENAEDDLLMSVINYLPLIYTLDLNKELYQLLIKWHKTKENFEKQLNKEQVTYYEKDNILYLISGKNHITESLTQKENETKEDFLKNVRRKK